MMTDSYIDFKGINSKVDYVELYADRCRIFFLAFYDDNTVLILYSDTPLYEKIIKENTTTFKDSKIFHLNNFIIPKIIGKLSEKFNEPEYSFLKSNQTRYVLTHTSSRKESKFYLICYHDVYHVYYRFFKTKFSIKESFKETIKNLTIIFEKLFLNYDYQLKFIKNYAHIENDYPKELFATRVSSLDNSIKLYQLANDEKFKSYYLANLNNFEEEFQDFISDLEKYLFPNNITKRTISFGGITLIFEKMFYFNYPRILNQVFCDYNMRLKFIFLFLKFYKKLDEFRKFKTDCSLGEL